MKLDQTLILCLLAMACFTWSFFMYVIYKYINNTEHKAISQVNEANEVEDFLS